jgi:hypothetical protein
MWRKPATTALMVVWLSAACSSAGEMGADSEADRPAATAAAEAAATPPIDADGPVEDGAGFTPSPDDPVYVDLLLDCVYGENEAGSCERLESAGLAADDTFGLGNSLSQAPSGVLREECLGGAALSCGELNGRVDAAVVGNAAEEPDLLCLFHSAVRDGRGSELDTFHLQRLLGRDAPAGVVAAVERLAGDNGDPDALEALSGYVDPVCAAVLD